MPQVSPVRIERPVELVQLVVILLVHALTDSTTEKRPHFLSVANGATSPGGFGGRGSQKKRYGIRPALRMARGAPSTETPRLLGSYGVCSNEAGL